MYLCLIMFFFFKQKTAYEMRISDWSSDVCSSDLDLLRLQQQLSDENDQLQSLRISARQFAGNYHSLKAAMNARLQVGTTPGNPELVAQWNQAQAELQQVGASIAALNTLASQVSRTASLSAFLLESTSPPFEQPGAVQEDHRQHPPLAALGRTAGREKEGP